MNDAIVFVADTLVRLAVVQTIQEVTRVVVWVPVIVGAVWLHARWTRRK